MNNKILIELYIPVINKSYNIFIPPGKTVKTVTELLKKSLNDLVNVPSDFIASLVLCDGFTGSIINPKLNVKEAGLKNGSRVLLI